MEGIKNSSTVVLVFTKSAFESVHVRREIERAGSLHKPLINFRVEDVELDSEWEYMISNVHWLNATGNNQEKNFVELTSSLNTQLKLIADHTDPELKTQKEYQSLSQLTDADLNERLQQLSKTNKRGFINSNAHKYNSESYIERLSFSEFYKAGHHKRILFLLGEAGMGKTNEMCHLVQQSHNMPNAKYFAFNSQVLDKKIDHLLLDLFIEVGFNEKDIAIEPLLRKVNATGKATNTHYYFLFDAINEATSYPIIDDRFNAYPTLQLLKDLHRLFLKDEYSQFSLVISFRSTPFEYLKNRIATELYLDFSQTPVFSLERFTNVELLSMFERYRVQFDLQTSIDQFKSVEFSLIRSSLSSPLLFKLVVQGYEGTILPERIEQ